MFSSAENSSRARNLFSNPLVQTLGSVRMSNQGPLVIQQGLLGAQTVPGPVLDTGDTMVNKAKPLSS